MQNEASIILNSHGLIASTFAFSELPSTIKHDLQSHCDSIDRGSYLTLIANAGGLFWTTMISALSDNHKTQPEEQAVEQAEFNPMSYPDIIDNYCRSLATDLFQCSRQSNNATVLYPGDKPISLMAFGRLANWSYDSPLGLGIHSEYGLWLAYRLLLLSDTPIVESNRSAALQAPPATAASPCLSCDGPCVSACPASAVNKAKTFNVNACAAYRTTKPDTASAVNCENECHARNACPVGTSFQYSEAQRHYHMGRALQSMKRWYKP